ncbi:hypothetical protein AB4Y40_13145 [Paraburkholderia sp. EG287B]|uniref:hypothetical protein n=1 Tax=Paraburkholderia sp. EG287B TaxID=3237010 RepID=UPI0034D2D85C
MSASNVISDVTQTLQTFDLLDLQQGYLAQNNTQTIFTDPDTINRFQTELIAEHMTAKAQGYTLAAAPSTATPAALAVKTAAKTTTTAAAAKKIAAAAKRSKRN